MTAQATRWQTALTLLLFVTILAGCGSDEVVLVPGDATAGAAVYRAQCGACHGDVGEGTSSGPPLAHPLYQAPGFSDEQLARAVREGARQEHWDFGAMPGMRSLSDQQISDIVAYVRQLQSA